MNIIYLKIKFTFQCLHIGYSKALFNKMHVSREWKVTQDLNCFFASCHILKHYSYSENHLTINDLESVIVSNILYAIFLGIIYFSSYQETKSCLVSQHSSKSCLQGYIIECTKLMFFEFYSA